MRVGGSCRRRLVCLHVPPCQLQVQTSMRLLMKRISRRLIPHPPVRIYTQVCLLPLQQQQAWRRRLIRVGRPVDSKSHRPSYTRCPPRPRNLWPRGPAFRQILSGSGGVDDASNGEPPRALNPAAAEVETKAKLQETLKLLDGMTDDDVRKVVQFVDAFERMDVEEKQHTVDTNGLTPELLLAFHQIAAQFRGTVTAPVGGSAEERTKPRQAEEVVGRAERRRNLTIPIDQSWLLTVDKEEVVPRNILLGAGSQSFDEPAAQLAAVSEKGVLPEPSPFISIWASEIREVLSMDENLEIGTRSDNVDDMHQLFDLARGVAVVKYIEHFGSGVDITADDTLQFASHVAERMFALVAVARTDIIAQSQFDLDDQLGSQGQQSAIKTLLRTHERHRLPTTESVFRASGIQPRALGLKGFRRHIRQYPTSRVYEEYLRLIRLASSSAEDATSRGQQKTASSEYPANRRVRRLQSDSPQPIQPPNSTQPPASDSGGAEPGPVWHVEYFQELLPTWEEMEIELRKIPRQSTEFRRFLVQTRQYEVFTREFVDSFADYLHGRVVEYLAQQQSPACIRIVDAGAGQGRLLHFVMQAFFHRHSDVAPSQVEFISVDTGEWKEQDEVTDGWSPEPRVLNMHYSDALARYAPTLVVCCWMPPGEDWTESFRAAPGVMEYILIGEAQSSICGRHWETWGVAPFGFPLHHLAPPPPFESQGFKKHAVESVTDQQICKNDTPELNGLSQTFSFRRASSTIQQE